MPKTEPRYCTVCDSGCLAPAGYQAGGPGGGIADGDKSCRGTCKQCGEPVCSKCSKVVKKVRVCNNCRESAEALIAHRKAEVVKRPVPMAGWIPKLPEAKEQCASCPFRVGNDEAFKGILGRLKVKHNKPGPVTKKELTDARMTVYRDVIEGSGDFLCHASVYGPNMDMRPNNERRQCPGATEFKRGIKK